MRRVDRDESYLLQRSIPEPNSGCWLWLGAVNRDGYAIILLAAAIFASRKLKQDRDLAGNVGHAIEWGGQERASPAQ